MPTLKEGTRTNSRYRSVDRARNSENANTFACIGSITSEDLSSSERVSPRISWLRICGSLLSESAIAESRGTRGKGEKRQFRWQSAVHQSRKIQERRWDCSNSK